MRRGRGGPSLGIVISALLAAAACSDIVEPALSAFTLPLDSLTMVVGGTVRLYPTALDRAGDSVSMIEAVWSSSAPEVAAVDSLGKVTAGTVGRAVITALAGGRADSLSLQVVTVTFTSLALGVYHTCGLNISGETFCWGNTGGQGALGLGGLLNAPTPSRVAGGARFTQLALGQQHTCGLTPEGAAFCWGANHWGQLGIGKRDALAHPAPTAVVGGLLFKAIEAGTFHTCGITVADDVYCWGAAAHGEIGGDPAAPLPVGTPQPTPLPGGLRFAAIAAGEYHTCGLVEGGAVYCWGLAANRRLGIDSLPSCTYVDLGPTCLTPMPLGDGRAYATIDARSGHTCALQASGIPVCWGDSGPVETGGGLTFSSIVTGGGHTCGLAAGKAYCWGTNEFGQLGDRGRTLGAISPDPIPAHPELNFTSVQAGIGYSCGISTAQVAYCWGVNYAGQIGVALGPPVQLAPARIAGQP